VGPDCAYLVILGVLIGAGIVKGFPPEWGGTDDRPPPPPDHPPEEE